MSTTFSIGNTYTIGNKRWLCVYVHSNYVLLQSEVLAIGPWPGYKLSQFGNNGYYYNDLSGREDISSYNSEMTTLYNNIKKYEYTDETYYQTSLSQTVNRQTLGTGQNYDLSYGLHLSDTNDADEDAYEGNNFYNLAPVLGDGTEYDKIYTWSKNYDSNTHNNANTYSWEYWVSNNNSSYQGVDKYMIGSASFDQSSNHEIIVYFCLDSTKYNDPTINTEDNSGSSSGSGSGSSGSESGSGSSSSSDSHVGATGRRELSESNINYLLSKIATAIKNGASNVTVDTATLQTLGIVKPDGTTITIDNNGVISANFPTIGIATTSVVGIAKPDNDSLTIDANGTLSINDTNYTNAELSQMWVTAKAGGSNS